MSELENEELTEEQKDKVRIWLHGQKVAKAEAIEKEEAIEDEEEQQEPQKPQIQPLEITVNLEHYEKLLEKEQILEEKEKIIRNIIKDLSNLGFDLKHQIIDELQFLEEFLYITEGKKLITVDYKEREAKRQKMKEELENQKQR